MTGPAYLRGYLAPVPDEIDAYDLPVTGALPPALTGRYFRNGPNPMPGQDPGHWFTGSGMIHGVRLRDGRAEWYRNRWVRTAALAGAAFVRPDLTLDLTAVPANTHVIRHDHRILALVEAGLPYEVTPELETVGPCDFDNRLTTAMTAHPKQDPETGELHFFGYSALPPYLTYHRLSATGELVESYEVAVPGPTMMHDFAITARHVVWLDLPVVFDPGLVERGIPYRWDDGYGARLGVMPRDGSGQVRWFEVEPCYVFHVGNAYEDGTGTVVLDAVRYDPAAFRSAWIWVSGHPDPARAVATRAARAAAGAPETAAAHLHRWRLDPAGGTRDEERLDDRGVEFPTHNDRLTGRPSRYLYTVGDRAIVKYDTGTGVVKTLHLSADRHPGEAVFVPADGARGEDEGWLLTILTDPGGSELFVLDAAELAPVACVRLPRRVPAGFHGSWIADG
ncbi:carotenoid oxygenase family protein [Planosporangium sp. 12N6]|uniref:carotenoid oxygenase family protein n=1 Tax=Planosporangium spinosum TaxID=3402278 RepID=UPI003CF826F7